VLSIHVLTLENRRSRPVSLAPGEPLT
jgi:hypothetical protein